MNLIEQFNKTNEEDWHAGLHAANNILFLLESPEYPTDYMRLHVKDARYPRGALAPLAKEWLTKFFLKYGRDMDGLYYGDNNPCTVMEIFRQKVTGLTNIARIEMPTGCDRKFWVANREILNESINNITAARPVYERISKITKGEKFCATWYKSAAAQIIDYITPYIVKQQNYSFFDYLYAVTNTVKV